MNVYPIRRFALVVLGSLFAAFIVMSASVSRADSYVYPTVAWNGYKIYLSQAHQGDSDNIGCDGFSERQGSVDLSWEAASGAVYNLADRGYWTRIGTQYFTTNTASSNSWGSDYHIVLHSNAPGAGTPWDCTVPFNYAAPATGTQVYHYPGSTQGSAMANSFDYTISPSSPGYGSDWVSTETWHELAYTNMPAVYLESGYHTFGPDKDWILAEEDWAWRIGWAIDRELGYP